MKMDEWSDPHWTHLPVVVSEGLWQALGIRRGLRGMGQRNRSGEQAQQWAVAGGEAAADCGGRWSSQLSSQLVEAARRAAVCPGWPIVAPGTHMSQVDVGVGGLHVVGSWVGWRPAWQLVRATSWRSVARATDASREDASATIQCSA